MRPLFFAIMIPFVDIHTHQPSHAQTVVEVVNKLPFDVKTEPSGFFSAGVHPWYIEGEQMEAYRHWLEELLIDPHCLMVGEAGLDGSCLTGEDVQRRFFQWQIALSASLKKPLLVHCVRKYNEMIVLSDRYNSHPHWILHGFQSSVEMVYHLLERNFLFSFGAALLRPNTKLVASLRAIPVDRLFFETDDSGLPIGQIYHAAAAILELDVELLKEMIFNNFNRLFNVDKLA